MKPIEGRFYTTEMVGELLGGISRQAVKMLSERQGWRAFIKGRSLALFDADDVEGYLLSKRHQQKPTITLMIGLPASGKTTIAKTLPAFRVSRDDIDAMLGGQWSRELAIVHGEIEELIIHKLILSGRDVVVDRTNLTPEKRARFINLAKELGVEIVGQVVLCRPEICRERNAQRDNPIPDEAMSRMIEQFVPPTADELICDMAKTD